MAVRGGNRVAAGVRQNGAMTVRVLYIGGSGRSGSTLVDRVIGQLPGFFSAGELNVIAWAGVGQNRLCGCGAPFNACPFWTRVGDDAFGGWNHVDRDELRRASASSYPGALRAILGHAPQSDRGNQSLLWRLYDAVSRAANGATVIDSSKDPTYVAQLTTIPELDVRAIHLVRDSRGVANSWSKTVTRPDVPGQDVEMLRMNAPQVAVRWILHNTVMELLGRRMAVSRLRYEDLLGNPRREIARLLAELAMPVGAEALEFIGDSSVRLEPNHTVMGNPMRMQTGDVPLRLDDTWRSTMPAIPKAIVTASTWPFLVRYAYPLRSRA